jgi:hypothetical protein
MRSMNAAAASSLVPKILSLALFPSSSSLPDLKNTSLSSPFTFSFALSLRLLCHPSPLLLYHNHRLVVLSKYTAEHVIIRLSGRSTPIHTFGCLVLQEIVHQFIAPVRDAVATFTVLVPAQSRPFPYEHLDVLSFQQSLVSHPLQLRRQSLVLVGRYDSDPGGAGRERSENGSSHVRPGVVVKRDEDSADGVERWR